jgi:uncharacterized membrane protein
MNGNNPVLFVYRNIKSKKSIHMVDITTEIIINRPVNVVADYATDPGNAPEWYVNIKSVEWKSPKPLQVGSQVAFTAQFLGRKLEYIYEITELVAAKKLVMRTAQGPFPMETTYTWTALDANSTKMTLRNTGKPSGFSKLVAPFMATAMKRANNKDLQTLKKVLEREKQT